MIIPLIGSYNLSMALAAKNPLFCPDCGGAPAIAGLLRPLLPATPAFGPVLCRDPRPGSSARWLSLPGVSGSRGAGNQPSVHHRRPGVHQARWLVTLCPACHAVIHKLLANRRWLPVPLLELWCEQHPHAPLQLQLGMDASSASATGQQGGEVPVIL